MIIEPYLKVVIVEGSVSIDTERGEKGFGSSDDAACSYNWKLQNNIDI
jgi:hypothetical protein